MQELDFVLDIIKKKCPGYVHTFLISELFKSKQEKSNEIKDKACDEEIKEEEKSEKVKEQEKDTKEDIKEETKKREISFLEKNVDLQTIPNTFSEIIPRDGTGLFSYQHHYHRVPSEMMDYTDRELMEAQSPYISVLRMQAPEGQAFQFAIKSGTPEENLTYATNDKFLSELESDYWPLNLISDSFLKDEKRVILQGDVGADPNHSGLVFPLVNGTYKIGVVYRDFFEVFLNSGLLRGRFLFTRDENNRIVIRPEDQTPYADTQNVNTIATALKVAGHKNLIWSSPTIKPMFIDLEKPSRIDIVKADDDKKIVYGVVLDPYQEGGGDAHNDYIPPSEIERTAHNFMKKSRVISLDHSGPAAAHVVESFIEQYPSKEDYKKAIRGEPHTSYRREFGKDVIHSGAWILGTQLSDELWEQYISGNINAYSIEGFGNRKPISLDKLPRVKFIDLVPLDG